MCGIVGAIGFKSQPEKSKFINMNASLRHRGPDGEGVYFDENVSLGHTRLAILDLHESANQPMRYRDYVIVYNGEIYNYRELKIELEELGYFFHTESDTEVVLASYCEWKEKAFHRFNGMWAMAIYNRQNGELILCRDRFGIKPLYYYSDENLFLFASEKKAVLTSGFIQFEVDEMQLKAALGSPFIFESSGYTEYLNLYNLLPGHYLKIDRFSNNFQKVKWWNLLENLDKEVPKTFHERVIKFRYLLEDACRIRLRADVPRTTSLSGGLDSSTIVSLISVLDKTQKYEAFTHTFEGTFLDELKYAKIVADDASVALHEVCDNDQIAEEIDDILYAFESIYPGIPDAAFRVYRAQHNQGYKISLDGHGVDELLGGYLQYVDLILDDTPLWNLVRIQSLIVLKRIMSRSDTNDWKTFFQYLKKRLAKESVELPRNVQQKLQEEITIPLSWKNFRKQLYVDFNYFILPRILKNFDAVSMANSIEVRMPFLDYRLVCYIFALPDEDLVHKGMSKYILRAAMHDKLDKRVNYRKDKIGFNSPVQELLSGKLKKWVEQTIMSSGSEKIFNRAVLSKEFEDIILSGKGTWSESLAFWKKISALRLLNIYEKKIQERV